MNNNDSKLDLSEASGSPRCLMGRVCVLGAYSFRRHIKDLSVSGDVHEDIKHDKVI